MKRRVLVTGATGIVGSHIARTFLEAGYRVRSGQRNSSNDRWLEGLETERWTIDLADPLGLKAAMKDVDVVVHAAGITSARTEAAFRAVNVAGTRTLAEVARDASVQRFVYVSSLAARGPDRPDSDGEDRPNSAYGRSKLEAEQVLRKFEDELEVVVLRPVTVYGPRDHYLLPVFRMASRGLMITPLGEGKVQFVHVSDLASATLAAATAAARFGPFPIAETTIRSWLDFAKVLGVALGRTVRRLSLPAVVLTGAGWVSESVSHLRGLEASYDVRRARDIALFSWTCDPKTALVELGWQAGVPLEEGILGTIEWYRKLGWL